MENNWLDLMNLLKMILISTKAVYQLKNKKKYLMNLLKKNSLNLRIQKKRLTLII